MPRSPGTRTRTDPPGQPSSFDGGALCVEFASTGGEGRDAVFETLHEPADLARWLAQPPLELRGIAISEADLVRATRLRAALHRALQARVAGEPVGTAVVTELNRAAAEPPLGLRLQAGGRRAVRARPVTCDQLFSTLAREMIELLTGARADRIRQCAAPDCPIIFVDTSRPGSRRWCSMERCGNRSKVRGHRARLVGGVERPPSAGPS